jgi:hypothetical protein
MQAIYNEQTGEWEYPEDQFPVGIEPPPEPAPPPPPGDFGAPDQAPGQEYWDVDFWSQRGYGPDVMFDRNGQLRDGWARTANGYEQTDLGAILAYMESIRPGSTGQVETPPPASGPTGGDGGNHYSQTGGSFDTSGFSWPQFNAPGYTPGPSFQAPPAFEFEGFTPPTADSIFADPSYQMRRDEGLQAIEHGAAARGLTRLPATLKALAGWNQDFASREYGNIFDRGAQTWGMNRNNAADTYSLNYGVSRDVWDRGERQNLDAFDRNYRSQYDSFDMNEFQPAKMTFDDLFRRYKAGLDATASMVNPR